MNKEQIVIIGPGMDGRTKSIKFLTRNWERKYGLTVETYPVAWKSQISFGEILAGVLHLIDCHKKHNRDIKLGGCSASASLMLNAYSERRDEVEKVVILNGFIRPGNETGTRSFHNRSAASPAFKQSVLKCVEIEPTLTAQDRKKILTVTPRFGDELVPPETVRIDGATNLTVPMGEHILSIALALILILYDPVIHFLMDDKSLIK